MGIFLILLLLSHAIFSSIAQNQESCVGTSCSCFDDFGEIEYQCPNSEARNKVVIHQEGRKHLRVECWNTDTLELLLPNTTFSTYQVTIAECPITIKTGLVLNIDKVSRLNIENSRFQSTFALHFFELPLRRLMKLSLKAITFDSDVIFEGINAPNLTSLQLEEIDMELGAKMFRNHSQLLELNLSFNNIAYLEEGIFANLTNLEILQISRNKIEFLNGNVFKNLFRLQNLQLDFNDIEDLTNETFRDLKSLSVIDLSNNNVLKVERDVFSSLKAIRHVYLDHNGGLLLDDYLFANFSKLDTISLGHCNIKSLPENLFTDSIKITEIGLENNYISVIPKTLFKGLVNLQILKLNNNKLKKLDVDAFKTLGKLKTLHLHYNELTEIDSDIFAPLAFLKELNMGNNEIEYIKNDSFKYTARLEKILMPNNRYVYEVAQGHFFSLSPFSSCLNLKELDLSNNLVKDVLEDLFLYSKHLRNLNLKGNRIETVDVAALWKIAHRGILLNLERNNITHFFFDESYLPDGHMYFSEEEDYEDVEEEDSIVYISYNPLHCDCYAETFFDLITNQMTPSKDLGIYFKYDELLCNSPTHLNRTKFSEVSPVDLVCPLGSVLNVPFCASSKKCQCTWRPHDKTVYVDCARKNLTMVPHILVPFSLDYNQTEVRLEGNFLKKAPNDELGYTNVTRLYLGDNQISNLTWIPPNIEVLDLSGNHMKSLDEKILNLLNASLVKNLTLGNNPWNCGCENTNMMNFLRKNVKKIDVQNIKCQINGSLLMDLTQAEICGDDVILYMFTILVFCIILSFIFVTLAFYYKYSQEIRIWMYARNICSTFLQEEELDKHKKYDVFISFSHKDEDFVVNDLVSELEKGPIPYKLCLHYRDWIPGDFISENIASSVTNSKRTLVVLTPNFLESVWGKMEFRTAHTEAMKERRNRVILVLKDDIDVESLDDELKSYMRTNTYIKWKDAWFWEKLKYALPHKRNREDIEQIF